MKVAAVLAAYVLLLAIVPGRYLARARWTARAPRWGIAAWLSLCVSTLVAAIGAGIALALPSMRLSASVSALLRECVMALRSQYRTPGGALSAAIGATVALAVVLIALTFVGRELLVAGSARRAHRQVLRWAGRRWDAPACSGGRCERAIPLVVEHPSLVAYCLPGRGGRIVLSSAALAVLDPDELAAVLAHERAHLAGRHHLLLATSAGLARAFGFLPLFALAREQTAVLVEMLADDRASHAGEPLTVASALLALAGPSERLGVALVPAAALGATETATGTRVRRLLASPAPLSPAARAGAALASLLVLITPVAVLIAPALAMANTAYCPV